MKNFLFKTYRYLIIAFVDVLMLGYIGLMVLVFLGKVGSSDDWKIANYCYFNIDSSVLDEHSSLQIEGDLVYYEYQHVEEQYGYQEDIKFVSDNNGALGGYDYHTYLYKAVDEIEIRFTLDNASIYKLQFTDIKVSSVSNDSNLSSLKSSEYKLTNKNNTYYLNYARTGDIYVYSVSVLYLVKK